MFPTAQPSSSTMQQPMTGGSGIPPSGGLPLPNSGTALPTIPSAYQSAASMGDSRSGLLSPMLTTDSAAGVKRLGTDAAPVVGVDNDDEEVASLVVSKEEVAARDSRQALFCTLDQLVQMVEILLKQVGCRGIMAAGNPDWDLVGAAVSLPPAACEYIIWNFQFFHYRHSLRLVVMDWNSAHKGVTFDRMQERDIDATRQAIVARAKVLLNYFDRCSTADEDDGDDTMADYPRALRIPARSNQQPPPQQPAAPLSSWQQQQQQPSAPPAGWQQQPPHPQQQLARGAPYAATPYGNYYEMYSNASMMAPGSEPPQLPPQQQQPQGVGPPPHA